jgi:ABC-2 type transport system ATP-binding protein
MLTGLLRVTSGSARLLGFDLESDAVEVKRRLGVVPDGLALFDRLTAREYLLFSGRMYGVERAVIRARSEELLELMGLQDERRKLIVDYSHGMKKKLALAAALLHEPRLLFLDEPFEGLDALAARSIKEILASLTGHGVTVFLTSHILEIVERLCRSVAIIHKGRLVAQGSLDELRAGIVLEPGDRGTAAMTLEEVFVNLVEPGEPAPRTLSWLE